VTVNTPQITAASPSTSTTTSTASMETASSRKSAPTAMAPRHSTQVRTGSDARMGPAMNALCTISMAMIPVGASA
jgi:hypothetical protein